MIKTSSKSNLHQSLHLQIPFFKILLSGLKAKPNQTFPKKEIDFKREPLLKNKNHKKKSQFSLGL
ncbi:hypothetical protein B0A67_06240 [Flavobacterium aquidurense]|jgi:hypothetical protein|nr:hypothetical protein B0A67_06240 [Flavobacterium aquidurense]